MSGLLNATTLKFLALLTLSNVFMNLAWYGHLKFKQSPLWLAILASWGLALVEYCFQVPANRIGSGQFSLMQLKIAQECLTLLVFIAIAWLVFGETLRWRTIWPRFAASWPRSHSRSWGAAVEPAAR